MQQRHANAAKITGGSCTAGSSSPSVGPFLGQEAIRHQSWQHHPTRQVDLARRFLNPLASNAYSSSSRGWTAAGDGNEGSTREMRINTALQQHAPSPVAVPHPQCGTLLQQHHQLGIAQVWAHNGSTNVDVAKLSHRPQ